MVCLIHLSIGATAAKAGEENYKLAVVAAANAGKFGKGVSAAGSEKQKRNAVTKGGARWAPGIAASTDAFGAGISKVLSTVSALTLPPRGVKGDPAIFSVSLLLQMHFMQ